MSVCPNYDSCEYLKGLRGDVLTSATDSHAYQRLRGQEMAFCQNDFESCEYFRKTREQMFEVHHQV